MMAMRDRPRTDVETFDVSPFCRLDVYRRDDDLVHGPCMSLYAHGSELMRWDLPDDVPHVHWAIGDKPRLYMPRGWPRPLVFDLACSQLVEHTRQVWRLCKQPAPRPSRDRLTEAATWVRPRLEARA